MVTNDNLDRDAYQQTLYDVAQAVQLEEEMLVHPYHHLHPIENTIILNIMIWNQLSVIYRLCALIHKEHTLASP